VSTDPSIQIQLDAQDVEPEEILERRLCKKGNAAYTQIKVEWTSLPISAATWEDYDVPQTQFPDAPAWGQAASSGGGGVTAEIENTDAVTRETEERQLSTMCMGRGSGV
jgi:hypothetical protein